MKVLIFLAAFIILIALAYLFIGLMYFINQNRFVYFPVKEINSYPSDAGLAYEDVWLKTKDGILLNAWFIESKKGSKVILVFHGNGGNISYSLDFAKNLYENGFSVMLLDYRGYGKSGGEPSEEGTYIDSEAAWDYLRTKGYSPDDMILLGRSLGGPIAARLASIYDAHSLILDSTFTSLKDIGSELHPYLPVRKFFRFEYDTLSYVKKIDVPTLFIHSIEDDYIPFDHAKRLFEAADTNKELLEIRGSHNSSFTVSKGLYLQAVRKFIYGD